MKLCVFFLLCLGVMACQNTGNEPDPLAGILSRQEGVVKKVLDEAERYQVQILYTQIDRDSTQKPAFTSYAFRLNADPYFYPASTVKLPAALLALEKMKRLGLDPYTPMLTDSVFPGQTRVRHDSSAATFLPSVAHYVRKIMLVSDNDAFNRLYEFLGQGPFNDSLHARGYTDTRIVHRLSIALSEAQNAQTNQQRFMRGDSLMFRDPARENSRIYWPDEALLMGKGEIANGQLVPEPKDFAHKNYFPLDEQQQMLRAIFFPEQAGRTGFDLSVKDYPFLYRAMGERPGESDYPQYPDSIFYDGYVKFLMYGDTHASIPSHIRIFNKVGVAYGFVTDNAYIVDFKEGIEFLLSATLYTNENQIFNDNQYEYDEIAFPFLAALGQAVYEYERQRPRAIRPDLSPYRVGEDW